MRPFVPGLDSIVPMKINNLIRFFFAWSVHELHAQFNNWKSIIMKMYVCWRLALYLECVVQLQRIIQFVQNASTCILLTIHTHTPNCLLGISIWWCLLFYILTPFKWKKTDKHSIETYNIPADRTIVTNMCKYLSTFRMSFCIHLLKN